MKLRWINLTNPQHENNKTEVYEWIKQLQADPDNEVIKEKIVLHYNGLVHSLAYKFSHNRNNHEDLAQVGMIGLLVALQRFDTNVGRSFEAYAIPTIIGEIKRFIRDKTWSVHVPRRIKELGPRIRRTVDELTVKQQRSPTITELASHLNVSEEEILETMEMTSNYRSLSFEYKNNKESDDSSFTLLDLIHIDENDYEKVELEMILEAIFPTLTDREQAILKHVFYDNLSQQEVGDILDISQMHVSRLQRRALKKLRAALHARNIKTFDIID